MVSFIPSYAFILFKYEDHYEQVLAADAFEIDGHTVLAKQADYNLIPYDMCRLVRRTPPMTRPYVYRLLLQPEDEASPKNIVFALNEDCIHEIWTHLPLLDLYNVAKTCRRFNDIAKIVFHKKYRNKLINLSDLKRYNEKMTTMRMQQVLTNFGSSITSFGVFEKYEQLSNNDIVGLLDKYCKNIKLLSLRGESIENFVIDDQIELFGRLKKLSIKVSLGSFSLNRLLAACDQLESLTIFPGDKHVNFDFTNVSLTLPHLVELNLHSFNCYGLESFLRRHHHIEIFSLRHSSPFQGDHRRHIQTNRLIYVYLPNIRSVDIDDSDLDDDKYRILAAKKNLRSVKVWFIGFRCPVTPIINEFLKQETPIEQIQLLDGKIDDEVIECMCKAKSIQEISLFCSERIDLDKIVRLVESLPNLKKITTCCVDEPKEFLDNILPLLQKKSIEFNAENDSCGCLSASYVSVLL